MWRRVLITAFVAAWCGYEYMISQDQLWMFITTAALLYCVWNFFLRFPPAPQDGPPGTTGGGTPPAAS